MLDAKFETVELHLGNRDKTWDHYGINTAPVFLQNAKGQVVQNKAYQAVLRNNTLAAIVSSKYSVFPNEEALKLLNDAGYKLKNVHYTNDGNSMRAEFLTEKLHNVAVGDVVQVGVMFRNSIDGSCSFGGDVFTYRLRCKNGAVAKAADIMSLSQRHIGSFDSQLDNIKAKVERLLVAAEETINLYQNWTHIKLNQEIAESIAKDTRLAKKYIPDYIEIDKKDVSLTESGKSKTVWETFNDLTEAIWHNADIDVRSRSFYTEEVHSLLAPIRK